MYPLKTKEIYGVKNVYLNTLRKIEPPHIDEMTIIEWHSVNQNQLEMAVKSLVNPYSEYQKDILEIGDSQLFQKSEFLPLDFFKDETIVQKRLNQIQASECQLLLVQSDEAMNL